MNAIQKLKDHILSVLPGAEAQITAPLRRDGFWSLDIDLPNAALSVHWREGSGFDLSTVRPDSYGEGADEHLESFEAVATRIDQIISGNENVSPPLNILLSRVREQRGMTQQQLATALGMKQASVSGIERREDIQLSTLRKYVEALGGSIEVFLQFSDGRYRLTPNAIKGTLNESTPSDPKRRSLKSRRGPASRASFEQLSSIGGLGAAQSKANRIREKHSVLEMY